MVGDLLQIFLQLRAELYALRIAFPFNRRIPQMQGAMPRMAFLGADAVLFTAFPIEDRNDPSSEIPCLPQLPVQMLPLLFQALQRVSPRRPLLSVGLLSIQIIQENTPFVNSTYIFVADPAGHGPVKVG